MSNAVKLIYNKKPYLELVSHCSVPLVQCTAIINFTMCSLEWSAVTEYIEEYSMPHNNALPCILMGAVGYQSISQGGNTQSCQNPGAWFARTFTI